MPSRSYSEFKTNDELLYELLKVNAPIFWQLPKNVYLSYQLFSFNKKRNKDMKKKLIELKKLYEHEIMSSWLITLNNEEYV